MRPTPLLLVTLAAMACGEHHSNDEAAAADLTATGPTLAANELDDYAVQDVCLDPAGHPTGDDPGTCPNHRNMLLDEPVRYWPTDASGTQATFSIPYRVSPDDNTGVLHVFDFGNTANINNSGHNAAFREYTPARGSLSAVSRSTGFPTDGYDVLERRGGYASYAGTSDGGGGIQAFVHSNGFLGPCVTEDGWLLWDQNRIDPTGARAFDAVGTLNIANQANGWSCPSHMNQAYTWWQLVDLTYTTGKSFRTLMSSHFGGASPETAQSMERFFYTKPYGRTRWEAWNKSARPDGFTGQCNGPTFDPGYKMFRVDCRDWSSGGHADVDGGWDPHGWPVDYQLGKGNWLLNGDFGEANLGYYGRWNNTNGNNPSVAYIEEAPDSAHPYNHYVTAKLTLGQGSVNQDVPAHGAGAGWFFALGARVWADQPGSPATLVAWAMYKDGSSQQVASIPIVAGPDARRQFATSFALTRSDVVNLRWELYLGSNHTYFIDDAFLTQT